MTEETTDQRMRRMAKEYGIPYTPPATAAPAAPVQTQQPAPPAKKPSGGDGIMGLLGGRKQQIDEQERKAVKGYAQGGKIKGPGTPTSDSIGGVVKETGEPIKVSTEERIVSNKQEQALMRIAEMLGFESVDAMFESMTGEPVGPTINGGMMAAATGMSPEDDPVKRGIDVMKSQLAPQQPAPTAQQVYAGVLKPSPLASNYVGDGPTDPDVNGRNAIAQPSGTVQRGIDTMKSQLNQSPAPMFADNAKASAAGESHLQSLYPSGTFDKPADTTAAPPTAVKPAMGGQQSAADPAALDALKAKPGAGILGGVTRGDIDASVAIGREVDRATGTGQGAYLNQLNAARNGTGGMSAADASGFTGMQKRLDAYKSDPGMMATRNAQEQLRGSGARFEKDGRGNLSITNSGDFDGSTKGAYTDANGNPTSVHTGSQQHKQGIADAANIKQQLANIQRTRLEFDATNPSITDQNVQAAAQKSLGILGNPADNQLKQVQAQGITAQNESNAMLADLQKKAIGGDQQALATLNALTGKSRPASDRFLTVQGGEEIGPDGMTKIRRPGGVFDAQSGQFVPMDQSGKAGSAQGPSFASKAELQAAIKAGKVKPGQTVMTPNGPMVVK